MDHYVPPKVERRDALVNEVTNIEDLGACFDLSAFPLPMRVGRWVPVAAGCACGGRALHVYMRVKPRGLDELPGVARDEDGTLELNTCTEVTQQFLEQWGGRWRSVEKIRIAVKNMVLHEVYEALMFRGERILDPHDVTRPIYQPF